LCLSAATPTQAAAPVKKLYFDLDIVGLPRKLCIGQTSNIAVSVSSSTLSRSDKKHSRVHKSWSGIEVSAAVSDTNVATVDPPKDTTVLQGNVSEAEDEELPNLPPTPLAHFEITPLKAGNTSLTVSAEIPSRISRTKSQVIGKTTTFEVINCNYRLTLSYNLRQREPEVHSDANGWLRGEMRLTVDPATLAVTGKGTIGSIMQGGYKEPLEECEDDLIGIENPIDVSGKLDKAQLNLKLQLQRAEVQATVRCKKYVPTSWVTMPPDVKRRTLFGTSPTLEMQFPQDGATRTHPSPYPPEYAVDGLFTVTVLPEIAQ